MKISFANEDEKNTGHTDIQKDRLVEHGHPPPHVSIDDYCGPALEIFRLFPIPEDDRGAWIKDKRSEKEERMDCFIRVARSKAPHPKNQLHPNPLSKGRKRAPPRMNGTLKPRKLLKRSPSKDQAQRLSSSRGHSVNLSASAASSESDDQDTSQQEGRPLHIHAARQETKDSSPRKPEDDLDPLAGNKSLVNQCETDTKDKAASGPVTPQKRDILFGRGGRSNNNPGNQYFLHFVAEYVDLYNGQETKEGKAKVVRDILRALRKENRRFLSLLDEEKGLWREDISEEATSMPYIKVGKTIRDCRNPEKQEKRKLAQERAQERKSKSKNK